MDFMMKISTMYALMSDFGVTQFLATATLLLVVLYYIYATRHHGVWEKLGVPGPKPWPIIDHKLEQRQSNGQLGAIRKWFHQYGNTYGAYGLIPHRAVLVTKDLSLIKQILVKDFDSFTERDRPRKTISSMRNGILAASGESWVRTRQVMSPMFTGAKLKTILQHVCDSANTLAQLTKQTSSQGQLIPLKLFATKFSTEVIARIAFGVETHAASELETEFAFHARKLLTLDTTYYLIVNTIYQYFPQIEQVLRFFKVHSHFIDKNADSYFVSLLESTIQDRKQRNRSGEKARDLLDMMSEAGIESKNHRLQDISSKNLNHGEIIGNSTTLILAGVETVSTTFQSILYCLALYEDIQEKVIAEIDQVFPKGTTVDYERLKDLIYTEQVINECLRLFPLVSIILRAAAENKTYGQITIPKGTYVHIALEEIMRDPEHWPDPEKFDPDRFSPENKAGRDPLTFVPFGYGPRICLGIRLAMMELKTVLVYLLREQRFILSERTEPKKGDTLLMKSFGSVALRPAKLIQLEVVCRK